MVSLAEACCEYTQHKQKGKSAANTHQTTKCCESHIRQQQCFQGTQRSDEPPAVKSLLCSFFKHHWGVADFNIYKAVHIECRTTGFITCFCVLWNRSHLCYLQHDLYLVVCICISCVVPFCLCCVHLHVFPCVAVRWVLSAVKNQSGVLSFCHDSSLCFPSFTWL